mmetsp:Transcript_29538/g.62720  ORF Transcript_29538/g.62720 Transcript_29538/m.62720 type:complete len:307 (-) Transcript_29538:2473-3393(-)
MSQPQLQNPRAVYFMGAPVSKAIVIMTGAIFVAAEVWDFHDALVFDTSKIFDQAQFHRIFLSNLTYASTGELIFGLLALAPLLRRFEREMGSRKFAAFLTYVSILCTIFELFYFQIFFETERYSGPYPQLGAVLSLYHRFTPRMHPKFFGLLGYDFSEKSLVYGLCAQVILNGGLSTFIPSLLGFLSGWICVGWCETELPEVLYSVGEMLGRPFVDEAPTVTMARAVRRSGARGTGRRRQGGVGADERRGGGMPPVVQPPRPPVPPPPEEAIEQLAAMGFDREAVIRALRETENNLEAAANRLLTS